VTLDRATGPNVPYITFDFAKPWFLWMLLMQATPAKQQHENYIRKNAAKMQLTCYALSQRKPATTKDCKLREH
jgi:hypothetical protein